MKPQTFILYDEIHQRHMLRHIGQMALAGITPEVVVRPYDRKRNSNQIDAIIRDYTRRGCRITTRDYD